MVVGFVAGRDIRGDVEYTAADYREGYPEAILITRDPEFNGVELRYGMVWYGTTYCTGLQWSREQFITSSDTLCTV